MKNLNIYILERYLNNNDKYDGEGKFSDPDWVDNDYFRRFLYRQNGHYIYNIIDTDGNHDKNAEDKLKKYVNSNINKLFSKFENDIAKYPVYSYDHSIKTNPEMKLNYYYYVYDEYKDNYCICCCIEYDLSWKIISKALRYDEETNNSSYQVELFIKFDKDFNVKDIELIRDCDYYYDDQSNLYYNQIDELKKLFSKEHNVISLFEYIHDNMLESSKIPSKFTLSNFLAHNV